jgi:hypothetical protein
MTENLKCTECKAKDLLYREVRKESPLWYRVLYIIGPLLMIGVGVINASMGTGGFLPLVVIPVGVFILWMALSGKTKDTLTSVRFQCSECSHEWDVEIQGTSYARKWQELPQTEWRKFVSGMKIPGLRM